MNKNILKILVTLTIFVTCKLWAEGESFVIIDVRTKSEWDYDHLERAIHLPLDAIESGIKSLVKDKDTTVYLYCRSGNRSGKALKIMQKLGYTNAVNAGGIKDAKERFK